MWHKTKYIIGCKIVKQIQFKSSNYIYIYRKISTMIFKENNIIWIDIWKR